MLVKIQKGDHVKNKVKQQAEVDIANLSTQQITDTYATNVFSLIWLVKAALPHMQPGSSIITTNSIQADNHRHFSWIMQVQKLLSRI